jgi:hypothetical protein
VLAERQLDEQRAAETGVEIGRVRQLARRVVEQQEQQVLGDQSGHGSRLIRCVPAPRIPT